MLEEKIIPIGEYILVSPVDEKETTESGLILSTVKPLENKAIVKAVGDKVNTDSESTPIEEGDTIIFVPSSGVKVNNSEQSDLLLSVKHVIGKLQK